MSTLRIAIPTEDGVHISEHFGQAPRYVVYTVEDGRIVGREERPKAHHEHHDHEHGHGHHHHHHHHDHHNGEEPGQHFQAMIANIRDCQVVILGGIGEPGYQRLLAAGYEVYLTGGRIEDAVQAYLAGRLPSDPSRVHHH